MDDIRDIRRYHRDLDDARECEEANQANGRRMNSEKADGHRLVVRLPENGTAGDGKPMLPPIEEERSLPPVEPSLREPGKGAEKSGNFTMRRHEEVPRKKYESLVHWPYNQPVGYKEKQTFGDPLVLPEDWSWFDNPKGKETSSKSKPRLVGVSEIGRASGDGVVVKGVPLPTAEEAPTKDWAAVVSGRERASLLSTRIEKGKDEWVPPTPPSSVCGEREAVFEGKGGEDLLSYLTAPARMGRRRQVQTVCPANVDWSGAGGCRVEVPKEVSEALSAIRDLILDFRGNEDILAATRRTRADSRYLVPMEAALAKVRQHVEEQAKEASFWRTELLSKLERQGEAIMALEARLSASPDISFEEGELRGPPLQQGLVLLEQVMLSNFRAMREDLGAVVSGLESKISTVSGEVERLRREDLLPLGRKVDVTNRYIKDVARGSGLSAEGRRRFPTLYGDEGSMSAGRASGEGVAALGAAAVPTAPGSAPAVTTVAAAGLEDGSPLARPIEGGNESEPQARKELWTDVVRKGKRSGAPTGTAEAGGKNGKQKPVPAPRTGLAGTSKASSGAAKGKTDGGGAAGSSKAGGKAATDSTLASKPGKKGRGAAGGGQATKATTKTATPANKEGGTPAVGGSRKEEFKSLYAEILSSYPARAATAKPGPVSVTRDMPDGEGVMSPASTRRCLVKDVTSAGAEVRGARIVGDYLVVDLLPGTEQLTKSLKVFNRVPNCENISAVESLSDPAVAIVLDEENPYRPNPLFRTCVEESDKEHPESKMNVLQIAALWQETGDFLVIWEIRHQSKEQPTTKPGYQHHKGKFGKNSHICPDIAVPLVTDVIDCPQARFGSLHPGPSQTIQNFAAQSYRPQHQASQKPKDRRVNLCSRTPSGQLNYSGCETLASEYIKSNRIVYETEEATLIQTPYEFWSPQVSIFFAATMKAALILASLLWIMTADFANSSPIHNERPRQNPYCTKIYKPVCGRFSENLVDFGNECEYNRVADRDSQLVWNGTCCNHIEWKKCERGCPKYLQGACGSDGITYEGSCYIDCHRLYEWGKQDLYTARQGKCD
ncbi:hypothetical protein GE061_001710 [Apolygus lucorum]|uniref:Kazal-like domain-containing protein n=1 Tax=Apolygus lucorum TaxID=248454 RepID=A0A8S9YCS2_APOLU|nr:hypothetical protein GE061_001710 [Apolygus lucorum]